MDAISVIGHLSFAMTAASFMITRMLLLQILAILSLTLGIVYNSLIAMGWPDDHPTPELWNVVGWLAVFLAINIIQSMRLVLCQARSS